MFQLQKATRRVWNKLNFRGFVSTSLAPNAPLDIHPEVLDALKSKRPVTALESTLITHGFPYPDNYKLGLSLENIVRSTGAIPATIGIVEGRIKIGLQKAELERLANPTKPGSVIKISRRDIAPAIATKADGGTTCSSTLIFAALAGIKVFATGGLGGVHRGGESSLDVSADLHDLARCPVGLVSSGVKSILDIGRTLEYLESLGVPVVSYGASKEFPAFFSPRSGFSVPWNAESPSIAAHILYTQSQLLMQNGVLFAVPIPEEYEAAGAKIQLAVDQAIAESEANGMNKRGKEVTPWLLKRVSELTKGTSIASNVALLENTALIGGRIAVEYQKLAQEQSRFVTSAPSTIQRSLLSTELSPSSRPEISAPRKTQKTKLVVIGSAAVDVSARASDVTSNSALGSTVMGDITISLGGVSRNIAEASHRVISEDESVLLVAPIGDDPFGHLLMTETKNFGMRTDGLLQKGKKRTAVCNLIMDKEGNLTTGIADMAITESLSASEVVQMLQTNKPAILAMDGNASADVISTVAKWCKEQGTKVLLLKYLTLRSEPTSVVKSTRILKAFETISDVSSPIDFISPNMLELREIYLAATEGPMDLTSKWNFWATLDSLSLTERYRMDLERLSRVNVSDSDPSKGTLSFLVDQGIAQMAVKLLPFSRFIVVKCGERGVVVVMRHNSESKWHQKQSDVKARYIVSHSSGGTVVVCHFPALPMENLVNVTGAGDSFIGTLLGCLVQQPAAFDSPETLAQVIGLSQHAALLTLGSSEAVSPRLSELKELVSNISRT